MMFRRSCKEVAALLVAREDHPLPLSEQVALRFHLAACKACPRFEQQLHLMRKAFGRWRNQAGGGDQEV